MFHRLVASARLGERRRQPTVKIRVLDPIEEHAPVADRRLEAAEVMLEIGQLVACVDVLLFAIKQPRPGPRRLLHGRRCQCFLFGFR